MNANKSSQFAENGEYTLVYHLDKAVNERNMGLNIILLIFASLFWTPFIAGPIFLMFVEPDFTPFFAIFLLIAIFMILSIIRNQFSEHYFYVSNNELAYNKTFLKGHKTKRWDRNTIVEIVKERVVRRSSSSSSTSRSYMYEAQIITSVQVKDRTAHKTDVLLSRRENKMYVIDDILEKLHEHGLVVKGIKPSKSSVTANAKTSNLRCLSCGVEISKADVFCIECGTNLDT